MQRESAPLTDKKIPFKWWREMNPPSHKRTAIEVESSTSSSSLTTFAPLLWGQRQNVKRPRIGEYRETRQESSNDDFSDTGGDLHHADDDLDSLPIDLDGEGTGTEKKRSLVDASVTSQEETVSRRISEQNAPPSEDTSRWVLRRQSSTFDSISSVVTELSASEVASALGENGRRRNSDIRQNNKSPMDSLVHNMETWSLTHMRALRRNNVFDTPATLTALAAAPRARRRSVQAARHDMMRTLRRQSSTLSSVSSIGDPSVEDDHISVPAAVPAVVHSSGASNNSVVSSLNSIRTV